MKIKNFIKKNNFCIYEGRHKTHLKIVKQQEKLYSIQFDVKWKWWVWVRGKEKTKGTLKRL